jgi:hypothetical protein
LDNVPGIAKPFLHSISGALKKVAEQGEPLVPPVGYSAIAGTANRDAVLDTSTVTLEELAQRVKALQEDLTKGS